MKGHLCYMWTTFSNSFSLLFVSIWKPNFGKPPQLKLLGSDVWVCHCTLIISMDMCATPALHNQMQQKILVFKVTSFDLYTCLLNEDNYTSQSQVLEYCYFCKHFWHWHMLGVLVNKRMSKFTVFTSALVHCWWWDNVGGHERTAQDVLFVHTAAEHAHWEWDVSDHLSTPNADLPWPDKAFLILLPLPGSQLSDLWQNRSP